MRNTTILFLFACAAMILVAPVAADDLCGPGLTHGTSGSAPGQFNGPRGILYLGDLVYVVDSGNHRVQKLLFLEPFSSDSLLEATSWGTFGQGEGQFNGPSGIALDGGAIYVADTGNHRIQKFTMEGAFLLSWGGYGTGDGQFDSPTFVDARDGYVIVSDTGNRRVQIFTADGWFVRVVGGPGSGPGQFQSPSGIDFRGFGSFEVADAELNVVQVFTLGGEFTYRTPPAAGRMMGISEGLYADAGRNAICPVGYTDSCMEWPDRLEVPFDSPYDLVFGCCYGGVLTDTGNDRIVFYWCADPVSRVSWGSLKTLYR